MQAGTRLPSGCVGSQRHSFARTRLAWVIAGVNHSLLICFATHYLHIRYYPFLYDSRAFSLVFPTSIVRSFCPVLEFSLSWLSVPGVYTFSGWPFSSLRPRLWSPVRPIKRQMRKGLAGRRDQILEAPSTWSGVVASPYLLALGPLHSSTYQAPTTLRYRDFFGGSSGWQSTFSFQNSSFLRLSATFDRLSTNCGSSTKTYPRSGIG